MIYIKRNLNFSRESFSRPHITEDQFLCKCERSCHRFAQYIWNRNMKQLQLHLCYIFCFFIGENLYAIKGTILPILSVIVVDIKYIDSLYSHYQHHPRILLYCSTETVYSANANSPFLTHHSP